MKKILFAALFLFYSCTESKQEYVERIKQEYLQSETDYERDQIQVKAFQDTEQLTNRDYLELSRFFFEVELNQKWHEKNNN